MLCVLIYRFMYIMSATLSLHGIIDTNKLTGPNFTDWLRNLRIVLESEKKEHVLDKAAPERPDSDR